MKNKRYTETVWKKALFSLFVLGGFQLMPVMAQVTLSGSSYTENFDGMGTTGTAAPTGWTTRTGATASARGTASGALSTNATTASNGAFNNYPNGTGRCLGMRQTGSLGDPGAAFELAITNTTGKTGFSMTMDHLMLSVQPRNTTWTVQYSTNGTSWTNLGTYADPGVAGATAATYSLGTGLDNISTTVYIRVVALTASGGSGVRDSYGLDNVALSWTNAASCAAPTGITKSDIKDTSVTLKWTPVSGTILGYQYAVTSSATPPASGTFSADTFVTASSLTFNTKYYIHLRTQCATSDFSGWVTDSTTTALPVDLIAFAAKTTDRAIELKWSTAQEINNDYFEVERSEDGKTFRSISTIKGKGTYRGVSGYSYLDTDPSQDKIYYRLKQVDFDGTRAYSEVITATRNIAPQKSLDNLVVYPNPATKASSVHYVLHTSAKVNLVIYNILGEPVQQIVSEQQTEGSYQYAIPELKAGVYFVQMGIDQYAKAIRIIVE